MYTWGQIRLILQQFAPGVSLDTIDEKINARYALILGLKEWKGLEKSSTLQTLAAITAGTINLTQGSAAVSGAGMTWTSAITGMQLVVPGNSALYTATFVDATDLTLDRPFEGGSAAASGYTLLQSIYSLPVDCRELRVIKSPVTGLELDEMTEVSFANRIGFPDLIETATMYTPQPDYIDPLTGETYQQIQLYPLPTLAQGYPVVYTQLAAGFDGVSTSNGPLAFVSDSGLIAGAKADLELEKESPNMARVQGFEALYGKHIQSMLHIDNLRRAPQPVRMDPAYTRHRTARILRGFGGTTIIDDGF